MFVLMRNRKIYILHRLMTFIPLLGGERALTKHLWTILPDRYKDRFRIEAGLNFYAVNHAGGLKYRVFKGISQATKEAKFGFWDGFGRRIRMSGEVLSAAWDLQWNDLPEAAKVRRSIAGSLAATAVGMLLGVIILAAGIAGPLPFFYSLFGEELRQDPDAPIARAVLAIASGVSASAILATGAAILVLNAGFFMRSLVRLFTAGRIRDEG